MGIKKAQTPSHTLTQACDSPNTTMVEVCAMERSFNVVLILFIKSRSRSQFESEIEQQKNLHPFRNACDKDGANRVQRARSLPRCSPFSHKFFTEDAFFSHFYRFNHIILHERGRIPEKRAATGAVKVQIVAIRPRRARFLPGFLKSEVVLVARLKIFLKSEIESSSFIADS